MGVWHCNFIAERLSARQLIVQRSHIASVYIYICIYIYIYVYIYIRHTLIARGAGGGCIAAVSVVPCSCTYCACEMQRSDLYREKRHCLRRE